MSGLVLLLLRILLALCLYGFILYVVYVLWRDIHHQIQQITARQVPTLTLTVQSEGGSKALTFQQSEITLGRGAACDCSLDDPTVSTRHARLSYHHSQWWLEDLVSKNGTFLNGQPVTSPVVLTSEDELRCGQAVAIVRLSSAN